MHVMLGKRKTSAPVEGLKATVAIVAKEIKGKIVSYRELLAKLPR